MANGQFRSIAPDEMLHLIPRLFHFANAEAYPPAAP